MAENPKLITYPFAESDETKTTNFQAEPTVSDPDTLVTQKYGWKSVYSTPLEAGGSAPARDDMNGLFNWITTMLYRIQKGWIWKYSSTQDYKSPAMVWDENELYLGIQDVNVGEIYHKPSTDITYSKWIPLKEYFKQNIPVNNGKIEFYKTVQTASGNTDTKLITTDASAQMTDFSANTDKNIKLRIPVGNGTLTINQGTNSWNFSADQSSNQTINLPTANNGQLTINAKVNSNGNVSTVGTTTFTANQLDNNPQTADITMGNGTLTITYNGSVVGSFSANQSNNVTIPLVGDTIPVGTVQAWAGDTNRASIPSGWLLCDGTPKSTTTYSRLFSVIGYKYGGSGSQFNVPNLVQRFIEGTDGNSGATISAGLPNITGQTAYYQIDRKFDASNVASGCFGTSASRSGRTDGSNGWDTTTRITFSASNSNSIYGNSNTVQPPAVYMRYIIKC